MPQAWNCRLTKFEQKAFTTLYGDARVTEGVFTKIYQLLIGSKAEGTIKCYIASIQRWLCFARKRDFKQFPPKSSMKKASVATFKSIQAAFPFFYAARNYEKIPITKVPFIKLLLDGALREASKRRGSVKKADTLDEATLKEILIKTFWPNGSQEVPSQSLKDWRTATKLYTYYKTMCRFDGWNKLTLGSFTFYEDHLIISFENSKNDQYYNGRTSVLGYISGDLLCPYLIFKYYLMLWN